MTNIAAVVARLKHWQALIIIVMPMLLYAFSMMPPPIRSHDLAQLQTEFTWMMLMSLPTIAALYVWIWVIGYVSNQKLALKVTRSDRLFNLSMPFVFGYLIFAVWAFPNAILSTDPVVPMAVVMPLHLFATVLLFYAIIFAARSISSLERNELSGFGRSFLFVLAILYFPIGVWFIQPRLNALSAVPRDGR